MNQIIHPDFKLNGKIKTELCQFLLIIPEDTEKFETLKLEIESLSPEIRVVRTSSPITNGYIWVEIFRQSTFYTFINCAFERIK